MIRPISLKRLCLALLLCLAGAARADVVGVAPNPAAAAVSYGAGTNLALQWTVSTNFQGTIPVSSSQGRFLATPNGPLLGTVPTVVGGSIPAAPGAGVFAENLQVPATVISQAVSLGFSSFLYVREFDDPGLPGSGAVQLNIVMPPAPTAAAVPALGTAQLTQPSSVSVTWNVATAFAGATSVSSPQGVFRAGPGGPVIGTVDQPLSRPVAGAGPVFIAEQVRVPVDVAYAAQRAGAVRIVYERSFSDGLATATAAMQLQLVGSSSGPLAVNRLALRFDDGRVAGLMGQGQALRAQARLIFSGSGLLQARWEVAEPTSTRGQPLFRVLGFVREPLVAGGQSVLTSPPLPTGEPGLYLVRLVLEAPASQEEPPLLQYVVGATSRDGHTESLSVLAPLERALLTADTRFQWRPMAGARAYQLEFYPLRGSALEDSLPSLGTPAAAGARRLEGPPHAGMLVPGDQDQAGLSLLARQRLQPGQRYLWRVLAIDDQGRVVAASAPREILAP